jgi:hypothetical protein
MQISTRVGVVQAIVVSSSWWRAVKGCAGLQKNNAAARMAQCRGVADGCDTFAAGMRGGDATPVGGRKLGKAHLIAAQEKTYHRDAA